MKTPIAPPTGPAAPVGRGGDRGSGAIIVVLFTVVILGLAAFVVDGGLSIANRERAADIAEQAARYAAQDLDEEALREGVGAAPINYANCRARVTEFVAQIVLTSASVTGHQCREDGPNRIHVEISVTYRPIFSGFISKDITVRGSANAEARTG